ncbi:amidohydrolase [Leucobacter weissii]|uniref:Amidohydrolase n=1 Tax=Leucobacter weissii TaxID=1983706 RepID=A0A939S6R5_9MICO|nr:amidohydrolase [Leucobacter weissii]MBO1902664.1 amidohydrolase [Leucobacter weissii]
MTGNSPTLLSGGRIWDGEALRPAALLIDGATIGRVIPAGEDLPDLPDASVVDLGGDVVFPGFVDAHAHPLIGGTEFAGAPVRDAGSVREAVRIVAEFAREHPELPWIVGEGFDLSIDPRGIYFAADLDSVVSDRPVALRSSDIHTMWANSRALRLAGITDRTPDPRDGVIERDGVGRPTGTLREWGAFMPLYRAIPRRPHTETAEALLRGLGRLSREGVSTAQDAWVELEDLEAYLIAARRGLPLRLNLAFRAEPGSWRSRLRDFAEARRAVEGLGFETFTARTVKFFADGIVEGGTAHVGEPYHGGSCCGLPAWDESELNAAAAAFDDLGFQLHIHAIGDAGVARALGAIEHAADANGDRDRRPVIAHAQLVNPPEIARLLAADVTVAVQPYWAKLDSVVRHLTNERLRGERELRQYPFRTLHDAGVRLASSSDYPITTPSVLDAMAVAMARDEHGDLSRSWLPEQRLGFRAIARAATAGSAYTQFADRRLGVIAEGAAADLAIVSGLPDAPAASELLSARVEATWFGGAPVFTRPESHRNPSNEENRVHR